MSVSLLISFLKRELWRRGLSWKSPTGLTSILFSRAILSGYNSVGVLILIEVGFITLLGLEFLSLKILSYLLTLLIPRISPLFW